MRILNNNRVVLSASDITQASFCQWAWVRRLDVALGRLAKEDVPDSDDPMLARAAEAGDFHETRLIDKFKNDYGAQNVVVLERAQVTGGTDWLGAIEIARQETLNALSSPATVVCQAAFFDGEMVGYADFVVKTDAVDGELPIFEVWDAKLALHVKTTALLQLAAYAEQLDAAGIPRSDTVRLVLGDGTITEHNVRKIAPTYRHQKAKLQKLVESRVADTDSSPWGDEQFAACGRCEVCKPEVESRNLALLVAGIRTKQVDTLAQHGIHTVADLAALHPVTQPLGPIPQTTLAQLASQAAAQEATRLDGTGVPKWEWRDPSALSVLPPASPGDIFFDFEGDPLDGEAIDWGIDYLFGVRFDGRFEPYWADSLAEEKQRFDEFIRFVLDRLDTYPDLHVYHYAPYERTHLKTLAIRHGIHIDAVDNLLRAGVLFDLYPMVKRAFVIGQPSYSIKKLEPLYMGDRVRHGISSGDDSVRQYVKYRDLITKAQREADPQREKELLAQAQLIKDDLIDYNAYDCDSTEELRNWLVARATEKGVSHVAPDEEEEKTHTPTAPLFFALRALVEGIEQDNRHPLHTVIALAASALEYYRNEDKIFWWQHIDRLSEEDTDMWQEVKGTIVFDPDSVSVGVEGWHRKSPRAAPGRLVTASGQIAPGTSFTEKSQGHVLYRAGDNPPVLPGKPHPLDAFYVAHGRVDDIELVDGRVTFRERLSNRCDEHDLIPIALTPGQPFNTKNQKIAVSEWARFLYENVVDDVPEWLDDDPAIFDPDGVDYPDFSTEVIEWMATGEKEFPFITGAALDILFRHSPRSAAFPPKEGMTTSAAIRDALLGMEDSFLAVQGPPGTGKTHTAADVIKNLVLEHKWRIGVVAQSHKTVENVLEGVLEYLPKDIVGKKKQTGDTRTEFPWTDLPEPSDGSFPPDSGCVIGGTAWDFSNGSRFGEGQLDLLVIDEAGQYSLANTIAVARAATRLLLLGDPQQLPEVSTGQHTEPINTSALGWLSDSHDILPAHLGVFLPDSWRMGEPLCKVVSDLSYKGQLRSVQGDHAPKRNLVGVEPGVHPVPIQHKGRKVVSPEEADAVVDLVQSLMGASWSDSSDKNHGDGDPLGPQHIIVVAPYNAHVQEISHKLEQAGIEGVPVGTVDKFQGRQAAIAIVSLAASSAADVPRGIEFLLSRNRLNVAISRAKWAAYVVHSPALGDHLPKTEEGLEALSGFLELTG